MPIRSETTGHYYTPEETVRIVRWKQVAFYMRNGLKPVDFYVSADRKTGEDILVFLFYRNESQLVYQKWKEMLDKANGYEEK